MIETHRYQCPLCNWAHDEPVEPMRLFTPWYLSPIFGHGILHGNAAADRMNRVERALEKHLGTHTTIEWLKALQTARYERDELRRGQAHAAAAR